MSQLDDKAERISVRIAVLTVSDTRKIEDDRSGQILVDRIKDAGHVVVARKILPDERQEIATQLREWCNDPAIPAVQTDRYRTRRSRLRGFAQRLFLFFASKQL